MTVRLNGSTSGYTELDAPSVAGNNTLVFPGGNGAADQVLGGNGAGALSWVDRGRMVLETAKASTSGTSIDFTGIPSWVKRVTVIFGEVSTNGTSGVLIRLGTSAGIEATGYVSSNAFITGSNACGTSASSVGFVPLGAAANATRSGCLFIVNLSGNFWSVSGTFNDGGNGHSGFTQGAKLLPGTLDRIRITTVNGTGTFDAGTINILYE